ncbi:MAG TPA: NAD-dependent epimerase/dehydratase family protein [Acidimicrobiales bacterium]
MRVVVTGAAGFVGSRVAECLLDGGHRVVGVDALTPDYDPARKRANLAGLAGRPGWEAVEADLRAADVRALLAGADAVCHLAARPGVRSSWGTEFAGYAEHNVVATARVLEAAAGAGVGRVVLASSSSVYGTGAAVPTREDAPVRPHSPYGVTKAAAEHLAGAFAANFGLPVTVLRFFTVYGPRQRPDMAVGRMVEAALGGPPYRRLGPPARRDLTFVDDTARATVAAVDADLPPGTVLNVGSGRSVSMAEVEALVAAAVGRPPPVEEAGAEPGDVDRTEADVTRAADLLGWEPAVALADGIAAQVAWRRGA